MDRNEEAKPASGKAVAVPPAGISMSATDNRGGRCTDCTKRTMMSGTVETTGGDFSNFLSGLRPAVVNKSEHKEDAGAMHYQWIVRESIMITEMNMPSNYLEIPELKIPKLFLHLAEEARDVEVNNDISGCTEEVKSQATGLQSQILVTDMTDGQPIPFGNELVNDVVSTEIVSNDQYVGRFKPMDRAYQVVSPDTTEQSNWLGLGPGGRQIASVDKGGPLVNEPGDPADKLEPVVLLGPQLCKKVTNPVVPVNQDVNLKEDNGLVDRSGPEETQSMNEPSALLTLKTDWMENAALGPVGPDGNLSGRDEAGDRSDPATSKSKTDRPVWTDVGGDAPNYSVVRDVLSTGQLKVVTRSDPVGPRGRQDQSVPLRLNTDQGEHIPTHRVHPGVKMFRAQPVADGPAGPDRSRRPVGTEEIHAVHDDVQPTSGGPVGRLPDPGTLYRKIPSPDDSYQPLITGPLGTDELGEIVDRSRPTASGPLGRPCGLDLMGPRAVLSLGDGNQPPSMAPVGRSWILRQPGDRDTNSDDERSNLTRSESESDTEVPDSMFHTRSDAQVGQVNISMDNGPADVIVIPPSNDSAVRTLGEQLIQTESEFKSDADIPVSVPQTGSGVQTDRVNISTSNGQTDWCETSLSSDSGIHSWTEQWENMSENSTDGSVHHTVVSHREDSGRVSHLACRTPPNTEEEDDSEYSDADGLLAMKLGGYPSEETYGQDNRTLDSTATGAEFNKKADIAALSDFSDESSEPPAGTESWFMKLISDTDLLDGAWTRWDYGTLPEIGDPAFNHMIKSMLKQRLAHDADPRLDRYYPQLVQSLAKARRMSANKWAEHDKRLNEEGRICTETDCRCSEQLRQEMVIRTLHKDMLSVDVVSRLPTSLKRFPDRQVGKLMMGLNGGEIQEEVPGTYTPPIRRRRGRKYASLRKYETDVEDYFSCSEEEEDWVDRSYSWY